VTRELKSESRQGKRERARGGGTAAGEKNWGGRRRGEKKTKEK
jgi:hypothetical protein